MPRVLVTGSTGQIGSELTPALRKRYGADMVIAAGHRSDPDETLRAAGPYAALDIRDRQALEQVITDHAITTIYHLAALLSANAEEHPMEAWDININGLLNVLEAARLLGCRVFHPSSIGAFGPSTPRDFTPQETIQRPETIYGITKVTGELLGDYYAKRYKADCRGVRYPGLISYAHPPGGGTTDYAVEMFHAALRAKKYTCYLEPDTRLDMMYMPDAVRAAIELMEADTAALTHRNAFNVTAMSLTPAELAAAIQQHIPVFTVTYEVDLVRQAIADSWPDRIDDSEARRQWCWQPQYDLESMVADMLARLAEKLEKEST